MATGWGMGAMMLALAAAQAQPTGAPSAPGRHGALRVVSAGSEQVLQLGDTPIARPFGAELVDKLTIIGLQRVGPSDVFLVRGSRGANCPARYVAVTTRAGTDPIVSRPFGTCLDITDSSNSAGRLTLSMPQADGAPLTYVYADGELLPEQPEAALAPVQAPSAAGCRLYGQPGTSAEQGPALLAAFERDYPQDLRKGQRIKRAQVADGQLHRLIADMACLATWPGADPLVPETAAPLFGSKRFGREAFAITDALARSSDTSEPMRAALRSFAAQMYFHVSES